MAIVASWEMEQYLHSIQQGVQRCYVVAQAARERGLDPESTIPIPLARNMAERVVGLISVVCPKIAETKITERIMELERKYGMLDWRVGFIIAEEVAKETFCTFDNLLEAMEIGIRVGFAYLTLGIVSAPLEGFIGLKIKQRRDGKAYFALQYAGPIRGAGGTAASISVILADYIRVKMGYSPYDPEEAEISRAVTEVQDYHERITNLQYFPSEKELVFLVSHLPVEVDGDPTETMEVSNHKDLARVETNLIRGGVALVLAEGLCQKAPKLWKRLSTWGKEFQLEWDWLKEFIKLKEEIHAAHASETEAVDQNHQVRPNNTFIMDLVAGRPILTHPLAEGGFRLRYGRNRTSGFSATALHPATLLVLDRYIAIGTQLKVERPGKGAAVTVCDTLEGPIVRLKDGSVLQLRKEEEARRHHQEVEEVLFLGDILFNYGDFSENGHRLVPPGYCPEWWALEAEKAIQAQHGTIEEASLRLRLDTGRLQQYLADPLFTLPEWEEALSLSTMLNIPLHPEYTYYWRCLPSSQLQVLLEWLGEGKIKRDGEKVIKMILPYYSSQALHQQGKRALELVGIPHAVVNKENIVLEKKEATVLLYTLGCATPDDLKKRAISVRQLPAVTTALEVLGTFCPTRLHDKAGTFIGARMGRPEKAKMRHLTGSPQVMFPVGEEGDRLRSFQSALGEGKVRSTFPLWYCSACQRRMVYRRCEECGKECIQQHHCRFCGDLNGDACRHGKGVPYKTYDLDIKYFFNKALERLQEQIYPDLIKGIRGTSNKNHIVEHLAKGILRSKHALYVNKDGTTRYDCTELPLTHFKPKEIKASVEKLRELGYLEDIHHCVLTHSDQLLELRPQDIILPGFDSLDESAPKVLLRVAQFVDDLLVRFYGMDPFYNLHQEEDLIGHYVVGLAPHISAGLVGRIIGFSETQALLAHPLYHAGLRRDCDGDEAAVMLLMDALLNFSRQYLPEKRGAKTMDSPLVLTALLDPAEVDDQVHGLDVLWRYPLEFYEAALKMKNPWEVRYGQEKKKIEQLGDRLGTPLQHEQFGFTHHVDNINHGVRCSVYKTAPSMEEKLIGQMEIAKKLRAVDIDDVAKLVIQKHFLKDIKGNLRQFSTQQFRCVKCNEKYRRPPLSGICTACGGKLLFTVTEGTVVKYLSLSLMLAERYAFSPYLKQNLELLNVNVGNIFGKEKEKQVGLGSFFNA